MKKITIFTLFFFLVFSLLNAQNFCLDFGGTEDYVDIGTGPTIVKTVEFWVNPATTTEYLVDLNGTEYIWINSGTVTATGFSSPTIYVNGVEATSVSANEWQHIAVTTATSINASDFDIGRTEESNYLDGTIDEVCIWNDVRAEDEIRPNMYRELINPTGEEGLVVYYKLNEFLGTTADNAQGNASYDGTLTGTDFSFTNNKGTSGAFAGPGNCLLFDGVNEYIDIGIGPTIVKTVEFWVKPTTITEYFIDLNGNDYISSDNGTISATGFTSPTIYVDGIESTVITSNNWQHVAVTTATSIDATDLDIGRLEGQEEFDGKIDEVRLWSDDLTQAEILGNMNNTLDGDETDLVAYYRFDQENITGQTKLYDITSSNNHGDLTNMEADADWVDCETFDTWIGFQSPDWNLAGNWSDGLPTATRNVGIPYYWTGGNSPTLSSETSVHNIIIGPLATLNLSSNLNIKGNYYEYGTLSSGTSGNVIMNGSSKQYLVGSPEFYNLTINNTHASNKVSAWWATSLSVLNDLTVTDGIFYSKSDYKNVSIGANGTLELSGNITVSGNWTNNGGTLTAGTNKVTFDGSTTHDISGTGTTSFYDLQIDASNVVNINTESNVTVSNTLTNNAGNAGLVIESDVTGTGSLIESNGVSATIERYITQDIYHYLSSPIDIQALTIFTQGLTAHTDFDLFWYDEDYGTGGPAWIDASAQGGNMDVGLGYAYTYKKSGNSDTTLSFLGTTNTGTIAEYISFTYNPLISTDIWYFGWNLVGNSYPSRINATTFINDAGNSNIYGTLYFWDEGNNYSNWRYDYATWNLTGGVAGGGSQTPNGYIGVGQAFMVHTTTFLPTTIVFKNNMRVHTAAQFFKDEIKKFKISVVNEEEYYNETLIGFLEGTTKGFDNKYDGYKLKGNPNIALYTKLVEDDGYDYAIQGLPPLTDGVTVKLGIDAGTEGIYTFNVVNIENFHDTTNIFLEDMYEDIVVNMRKTNEYSFTINESGSITDRFLLHFNTSAVDINEPGSINNQIKVYTYNDIICIENNDPFGDIYVEIFNTLGQQLISRKLSNQQKNEIVLNARRGIYIVRIICEDKVFSEKVYLGD